MWKIKILHLQIEEEKNSQEWCLGFDPVGVIDHVDKYVLNRTYK